MKAAIIQFKPTQIKPIDNFTALIALCEEAILNGVKLIHLPEMCLTPYLWNSAAQIRPHTEPKKGPTFLAFAAFAKKYSLYLAYGYGENDDGLLYNSQNLISPEGELIGHYRKRHLFDSDQTWAEPGNLEFQSIDTEIGKIGLGVCMDLNFNDFIQFHASQRTKILCLAVNWLKEGTDVTAYWSMRLWPFNDHCLIANRFGPEKEIYFAGLSSHFFANKLVQQGGETGNQILITEIPDP